METVCRSGGLYTPSCQVEVSPVTQRFPELCDDKHASSQSSEEMPGAKQTLQKCPTITYIYEYVFPLP